MKSTTTVKKNYEFRRMYAKGKSGVSSCLVVYYRKNRLGHNRLGVTVSTKLGHAVVRNRVRRRIREIFRLSQGKMKQGYDCIVVARTRAAHADYWELKRAFEKRAKSSICGKRRHETLSAVSHPVLPQGHLALPSPLLPLYPHVLSIRARSDREVRGGQGRLACLQAYHAVPSVL